MKRALHMLQRMAGTGIFAIINPLLSAIVALMGQSYLSGSKTATLEGYAERNRMAIELIRTTVHEHLIENVRVMELLAQIRMQLAELQAEQRLLHGQKK